MNLSSFYKCKKNNTASTAVVLLSLLPAIVSAQSVTNIDMTANVIQPAVQRLGMNIGNHNTYDSGQITKNLLFQNPGFEPQLYQSIIRCQSGTPTTFTDDNPWAGWPANFWKGASFEVV